MSIVPDGYYDGIPLKITIKDDAGTHSFEEWQRRHARSVDNAEGRLAQIAAMHIVPDDKINRFTLLAAIKIARGET